MDEVRNVLLYCFSLGHFCKVLYYLVIWLFGCFSALGGSIIIKCRQNNNNK